MMPSFGNWVSTCLAEPGGGNTFSSQIQGAIKVKLEKLFRCFDIHIQALIREALSIVVHVHRQVEGSFSRN